MKFKLLFFFLFFSLFVNSISAFTYDNPNLPKIDYVAPTTTITFNNNTDSVNSSDYWDSLNTFNPTQMQNSNGILNILESWLNSLWCKLTGCTMTGQLNIENNLNVTQNVTIGKTLFIGSSGNFTICENSTQATYIGYFGYGNCTQ